MENPSSKIEKWRGKLPQPRDWAVGSLFALIVIVIISGSSLVQPEDRDGGLVFGDQKEDIFFDAMDDADDAGMNALWLDPDPGEQK